MKQRRAIVLAWCLCGLALLLTALGVLLDVLNAAERAYLAVDVALAVTCAPVGALIASHRRDNPIGWLVQAVGLDSAVTVFAQEYANYNLLTGPGSLPGGAFAYWIGTWIGLLGFFFGALVFLLFPTGRLLSRRWRPVAWLAGAGISISVVSIALSERESLELLRGDDRIETGLGSPTLDAAILVGLALVIFSLLASAFALVVRFRRSQGVEREQVKWVTYAAVIASLVAMAHLWFPDLPESVSAVAYSLVPVAAGIAILKHGLYDIDVVINKTVVFGALAAFITAVYVAIVVGVGALVGSRGVGLSIVATAIVAVAFQPVKRRVQRIANRLVYGERATPYEVLSEFSHRMASVLSVEDVLPKMAEAAAKGVGASRARARLFFVDGDESSVTWPEESTGDSWDRLLPVIYKGERVGDIAIDKPAGERMTPSDDALLSDLASQAGLALHNARLAAELRRKLDEISAQAEELRASRERIVTAQNISQQHLERQIHDGPELRLLAVQSQLDLAERTMEKDPEKATALLDALAAQANETLEELRDLARGVFPPLLQDRGLVAALDAHLKKCGVQVSLDISDDLRAARFDDAVESAIYFCFVLALENVVDHAKGARATLSLQREDGWLKFTVADQGPGFDPATTPRGLRLPVMGDRVEALGGSLEVRSQPGRGTTVEGRVPARALEPVS